ncbi:hypothetical protein A2Z33_02065 [Candidatus Gottesmanbacteria bacterium RBG_16_52_11]|uniref:Uncharacterized protein n=1 Tax=Candidatus Gottesmanbacteria bacterium RBG_16_52_11 TaxID=1798374 RepID=A0A1F5YR23_9BACT|nr:MAG: hypothetical protein A2Z33_02065 [Candidatus Gottesmanbacteria bacterium RBG_16_52_11]
MAENPIDTPPLSGLLDPKGGTTIPIPDVGELKLDRINGYVFQAAQQMFERPDLAKVPAGELFRILQEAKVVSYDQEANLGIPGKIISMSDDSIRESINLKGNAALRLYGQEGYDLKKITRWSGKDPLKFNILTVISPQLSEMKMESNAFKVEGIIQPLTCLLLKEMPAESDMRTIDLGSEPPFAMIRPIQFQPSSV